jgi:Predicted nucleotide-binding protein containing TIR-like domain
MEPIMSTTVFIGSSAEGLKYANAIQEVVTNEGYAVLPWKRAFRGGSAHLEDFVSISERVDAAILAGTPDDTLLSRDQQAIVIWGNVLFEYGLFVGRLGRHVTTLALVGNTTLPSDLDGISHLPSERWQKGISLEHYAANVVEPRIRRWLADAFWPRDAPDLIARADALIYKSLPSESEAIKHGVFLETAKRSARADYLVLRGRDLLSSEGEIVRVLNGNNGDLRVRLLMLDFSSVDEATFEILRRDMDLEWADLESEIRIAAERLELALALIVGFIEIVSIYSRHERRGPQAIEVGTDVRGMRTRRPCLPALRNFAPNASQVDQTV